MMVGSLILSRHPPSQFERTLKTRTPRLSSTILYTTSLRRCWKTFAFLVHRTIASQGTKPALPCAGLPHQTAVLKHHLCGDRSDGPVSSNHWESTSHLETALRPSANSGAYPTNRLPNRLPKIHFLHTKLSTRTRAQSLYILNPPTKKLSWVVEPTAKR